MKTIQLYKTDQSGEISQIIGSDGIIYVDGRLNLNSIAWEITRINFQRRRFQPLKATHFKILGKHLMPISGLLSVNKPQIK